MYSILVIKVISYFSFMEKDTPVYNREFTQGRSGASEVGGVIGKFYLKYELQF